MIKVFDGRSLALEREKVLRERVLRLKEIKGVTPKLATILVGNDPASVLYVNLKKKAAERMGCELELFLVGERKQPVYIIRLIKSLEKDPAFHGIMVQLPLPERMRKATDDIITAIPREKDVDGLREDSRFTHPTVMAIMEAISKSRKRYRGSVCVVGASGMVGKHLIKQLQQRGFEVIACDATTKPKRLTEKTLTADVVVSCTGIPGLITGEMIKEGAVVIDVGAPHGDVDFKSVKGKARFITPVPGGIGPLTITFLLENLWRGARRVKGLI